MERRALVIRGTVQGVGFRPFVFGLASRLGLGGFVRNHGGGVTIEVEGETAFLDAFLEQLLAKPPPLARIEEWSSAQQTPRGERQFTIVHSEHAAAADDAAVVVAPDAATCDDCLRELFDPRDRRYRYPFLNCTNCGPRLTIVTSAPYDRERTTMAGFPMCAACRAEFEKPADRRFHAQPIACQACGPRLTALDARGEPVATDDPLGAFVAALRTGAIGAMKGLGGYHLVCDARSTRAVGELRRRKGRDDKPFAVMLRDMQAVERFCDVGPAEAALLSGTRRPIVLLRRRAAVDGAALADGIAPGNPNLGVMLPYTPLHHLLLRDMDGTPLVMTSGNASDEPIAYDEPDATERLGAIADIFLIHNRPIRVRCDDSVTRVIGGAESPIRRSRGYAPQPISLPLPCPLSLLAVGAQLKSTFALAQAGACTAVISHHLGDLDHFDAFRAFERDVALYEALFAVRPACIVHDMHPDYASTRYAQRRAAENAVPLIAVQHHHAHLASCMAEHGLTEPVVGVTFDGTGFGNDGAVWGGEFLVGDLRTFHRAAHLRYVGMPGADQAIREPWRMAAAHLADAGISCAAFERRVPPAHLRTIRQMIDRRFNMPMTSSAGRLFDAVAALVGVRDRVSFEGQAAMELEWLAGASSHSSGSETWYPFEVTAVPDAEPAQTVSIVDTRPLMRAVAADVDSGVAASHVARRFHRTCVELISVVCRRLRDRTGIEAVVCSGGVFMNALLARDTYERLTSEGFRVYRHRLVPPNDGGLSLGQIAIAAAQWVDGQDKIRS